MAKTLQFRRAPSANVLANTTSPGELFVDTTQNTITVGDGTTPGGWYLATQYQLNANASYMTGVNATQNTWISANQAFTQAAFNQANTNNSNIVYLQGGLNTANANTVYLSGALATANANIAYVLPKANNAVANLGPVITVNSNGYLLVSNTVTSTSNTVGALVVSGGAAVKGNVYAGGYVYSSNGIGYPTGTGAGGTVAQGTSRTTGVTLNALSGTITLFTTTLAAQTTQAFVVTNSYIAATDMVYVQHQSGGTLGLYTFGVTPAAGQVTISVRSTLATSTTPSEAPVLQFMVLKGTTN